MHDMRIIFKMILKSVSCLWTELNCLRRGSSGTLSVQERQGVSLTV
jgi:hypothetical protein